MEQRNITRADGEHVARLAHLDFSEEEMTACIGQLDAILGYMQQLQTIDTAGVPPTTHVLPIQNVFREDEVRPGLSLETATANSPGGEGCFKVPRIL